MFFSDIVVHGKSTEGTSDNVHRFGKLDVRLSDASREEDTDRVAIVHADGSSTVKKQRWHE